MAATCVERSTAADLESTPYPNPKPYCLGQLRETPGRVVVPALERLAAVVDGNDEMRGFFVEAGGVPRLSQLAASDLEPCKGARQKQTLLSIFSFQQVFLCAFQYLSNYYNRCIALCFPVLISESRYGYLKSGSGVCGGGLVNTLPGRALRRAGSPFVLPPPHPAVHEAGLHCIA